MFLSAVVPAAFFASGAAGLIFQLIWFYRCSLVLGSSVASVTAVLTAFMGGLALGNALTTRYASRVTDYVRAYAALEVIVAAAGLLVTFLLPRLTGVIVYVAHAMGTSGTLNVIRFVLAFALMVVPAAAMGATLPILVAALQRGSRGGQPRRHGVSLGSLYGWNTLGAVTGVLASEFLLVSWVGITGSAAVAAGLNLAAAGLVTFLRRDQPDPASGNPATAEEDVAPALAVSAPPLHGLARKGRLVLGAAALSGAILLALEVMWFRFLSMYVLVTTAAMSLMLAVVLSGIGLGALVTAAWLARRSTRPLNVPRSMLPVAALACLAGTLTSSGYALFQSVTAGTQVESWTGVLWFATVLTFPVAVCSGCLFTLLGDALPEERASGAHPAARETSRFVLANTAGAIAGPPVAGYLLLPILGLERGIFVLAVAYAIVAAVIVAAGRHTDLERDNGGEHGNRGRHDNGAGRSGAASTAPRRPLVLPVAAAAAFVLGLAAFPFGAMATSYFPRAAAAYISDGSTIVASREGPSETIFVMQQRWLGQQVYSRLVTNGFSMSGTALQGQRYMRAFAYYPMLLHDGPIESALVICYGVGVTVSAVTHNPAVKTIDVAEISPDVVAMSEAIYPPGARPLEDRRVRVHIEDGRFFLQTTSERYDLITGEPPPPRTPGTASIYTEEFFRLVHDRLRDRGVATYWVPVGRPNPGTDVNTIIKAFCTVFDDCTLWNATPFDLMLMGSRNGSSRPISPQQLTAPWQTPGLEARLREVGFERAEQIGSTFVGDAPYLKSLTAGTPPLTDDYPHRLNPVRGRPSLSDPGYGRDPAVMRMYRQVLDVSRARAAFEASSWVRTIWPPALIERTAAFFQQQAILNRVYWEGGRPLRQIEDLDAVLSTTSLRTLPLWILGSDEVKQRIAESASAPGPEDEGTQGSREYARALRALSGRDFAGAVEWLRAAERSGVSAAAAAPLRAYALTKIGRTDEARVLAASATPVDDDATHFWTWLRARLSE